MQKLSSIPIKFNSATLQRWGWLVLLLVTVVLYLPGLGTLPMMDRDEPRFAHATVEMMQRGTWTVPYFNGEYRFDKPPLTYWWMRLHYHLLGVNEFAARLHTVLSTWLVALVIASIGRRILSPLSGLIAGLAWLFTLQVQVHGRLCVADMPMVLCVTLTLRALLELLLAPSAAFSRWHWLLYGALGLGFLAKGPIAWIIPALALLLMRFAWRGPRWDLRCLQAGKGMALALMILALWGLPALWQTQGQFWTVGMGEHVVERGASAFNGRFPVPGYYLVMALASLFPWIALLPQVVAGLRQNWSQVNALLVCWFAAPYVVFSLYATQLPHYVMPGFPAAMLLLVSGLGVAEKTWHRWWGRVILMLFALLSLSCLLIAKFSHLPAELQSLVLHVAFFLGVLCLLGAVATRLSRQQTVWEVAAALLVTACLALGYSWIAQDIRSLHPAAELRAQLGPQSAEARLMGWRFTEPSLVFHFDHECRFTTKLDKVEKELSKRGCIVIVALRREWRLVEAIQGLGPSSDYGQQIDSLIAKFPTLKVSQMKGFNAARSSWVELTVLERDTP